MAYVGDRGFPVPRVEELRDGGTTMVMEYLEGPTMLAQMRAAPEDAVRWCERLGELLGELHEFPAPAWLADCPVGSGDRLLHLDFHPLNVIVTASGPRVVDWANAARGASAADCALSWLLLACGGEQGRGLGELMPIRERERCLQRFATAVDVDMVSLLADVARWKAEDRNISSAELVAMSRFVKRHARRDAPSSSS
jgi:aminoglycoside phosphotransferase (APT) family kinase protein